ncbi:MAG TPA: type VI secretion system ATPase TssH [Nannocystaceae bacterium]|nr:type VI secretion system ATPase TssH [Nannocystaceae bacterium]
MRVEPKAIVRRLNSTCTAFLEAAVADAAGRRFYEIVPEHLLVAMLSAEECDARAILVHAEQDVGRLRGRVQRVLDQMRTGNQGRPVFAESLFQWLEDAWVLASLHFGAGEIRSGHLLLMYASLGHRYSAEVHPELRTLAVDALKRDFDAITAGTKEAALATAAAAASPGAAPAGQGAAQGEDALRRFTTSYTEKARQGKIDPVFGRHAEIRQLAEILARRRKNNPIIVGEPGVGKTALVEGLARAIAEGDVPQPLRGVELLELDMGLLQAGAGVRGEFEKRLKAVIEEVKASAKPIVLFIDEAHTIVGKENDAANLLKPALARGELRTIAATTWSEYKKYFEKDAAFARRFQPVKVDEPSEEQALVMLRGLREAYEASHKVTIKDEALVAAVKLSHRYIAGRLLPDKAVDLLDTAATRVRIEHEAKPAAIVATEERLAALEREVSLLRREEREGGVIEPTLLGEVEGRRDAAKDELATLQGRWNQEKEALVEVERAREVLRGDGGESARAAKRAADERFAALGGESRLIHAEVDADAIARVVETWTGIPAGKMRSDTLGALLSLEEKLTARVRGQGSAVRVVAETLRIAAAGIQNPNTPLGVLLFVGPSGVGKTETATALADLLYGGERFMTAIAMSEFQEKHSVSRLIGSPPGYVGYGEGGVLTEAVRQRPYSVVLLDECEKADLEVMNLFYQVFDKGTLSDGEGRVVDFKNTVVILTSNLASDMVMRLGGEGASAEVIGSAIRPALSKHFKPALLARMTVVPFLPLPGEVLREITALKLGALQRRLWASHKIEAVFEDAMVDELAARCTEAESGARNVEAILRSSLMPALSQRLLEAFASGQEVRKVEIGSGERGWEITLR